MKRTSITINKTQEAQLAELQQSLNLKSKSETIRQAVQFAYLFTRSKAAKTNSELHDKEQFHDMLNKIRGGHSDGRFSGYGS